MRRIAAFDFDGTLTNSDTLWLFLKYTQTRSRMAIGLVVLSPILILFKLRVIPNWKAKQILFSHFFRGMSIVSFNDLCDRFSLVIMESINKEAISKLKAHKENGDIVIIISASIENWIRPWASIFGIDDVLATKIESDGDGILTGRFKTNNCYGEEKVKRLTAIFPKKEDYVLYAYGDSRGDKDLLKFADYSYYRCFN